MQTLIRLFYTSRATTPATDDDLQRILAQADRNNPREQITGVLLFCEGRYVQALEGPRAQVSARYSRIANDPRHTDCVLLSLAPVHTRAWPDWAMRSVRLTPSNSDRLAKLFREFEGSADARHADNVVGFIEQLTARGHELTPA